MIIHNLLVTLVIEGIFVFVLCPSITITCRLVIDILTPKTYAKPINFIAPVSYKSTAETLADEIENYDIPQPQKDSLIRSIRMTMWGKYR